MKANLFLALALVALHAGPARADIPPVPGADSPASLLATILAVGAIAVLLVLFRRKRRRTAQLSEE